MKKTFLFGAIMAMTFCACNAPSTQNEVFNPVLQVSGGQIQGVANADSTVIIYKGVPFAAAPVGELRWKKPQPVTPWEGVKVADKFGDAAVQYVKDPNDGGYGTEFYPVNPPYSEDCLYLNVWAPEGVVGNADAKLPVAMWIHGGGYGAGWGYEMTMDGEAWAKRGVILVTINYRLGMLGFLNHNLLTQEGGGHSGNYGLYDQIAALQWIHDNIAQFGGNPDNITVFGQSAGAGSVKNVVSSPLSKNMVKKAIVQSGGGIGGIRMQQTMTQADLDAPATNYLNKAGFDTLEKMRAAHPDSLSAVLPGWMSPDAIRFSPHTDSEVLPEDFNDATMHNSLADIPYMMGHCKDDMPGMEAGEQRFAEVRDSLSTNPVYLYLFNRPLPTDGRKALEGSFHSSELWYVFHTLDRSWRPFTAGDYQLSDEMVDAWTNFCKFGNPNGEKDGAWKPSTKEAPFVYEFKVKE
ncbi:MAG: carboxylesterase family protein [Bacteroidales bacterium]|nr:carboxylesterase family protein [Bacteroidales bacterium]